MMAGALNYARRPVRRLFQVAYLSAHLPSHRRCVLLLRSSPTATSRLTQLKYLGNYLALGLTAAERLSILTCHYETMRRLPASAQDELRTSALIWSRPHLNGPPLQLRLEPAGSTLEGELQLRVSLGADLFRLTFAFAPGHICGGSSAPVICIGEIKGMAALPELREASRLNGEIAPRTLLMLAVQALARAWGIRDICIVKRTQQIAARAYFQFDYAILLAEFGGTVGRRFDWLPIDPQARPLVETSPAHRSRARRRREAKETIRASMTDRFSDLMSGQRVRFFGGPEV